MTDFISQLYVLKVLKEANIICPIHPVFFLATKWLGNPSLRECLFFFFFFQTTSVIKEDYPPLNAILLYSY